MNPRADDQNDAPAIEVHGLTKKYDEKLAVDDVSFTVPRGSVFTLVGPNGAGKTTTVEAMVAMRKPTSGTVRVLGHDVGKDPKAIRSRIGVLPQELRLFDRITPRETLAYFAALYDNPLPIDDLIALLGLQEHADMYVGKLSGGLRRRVCIATALVNDPDILFLDEPTTGIDPVARRAVWGLIRAFKAKGKSVFLTTHYMDEAEALSDTVAVIKGGRIVAQGSPAKLISSFEGHRVLQVPGGGPAGRGVGEKLGLKSLVTPMGDVLLHVPQARDIMGVLADLKGAGVPTRQVVVRDPSLDDVYVSLVLGEATGVKA